MRNDEYKKVNVNLSDLQKNNASFVLRDEVKKVAKPCFTFMRQPALTFVLFVARAAQERNRETLLPG